MALQRFKERRSAKKDWRMRSLRVFFGIFAVVIVFRLFNLQIVNAEFYQSLAAGQHSFYQELFAERGDIYVKDWNSEKEYLAATNEPRAFIFADPRKIEEPEQTTKAIARVLGYEITTTTAGVEENSPEPPQEEEDPQETLDQLAQTLDGEPPQEEADVVEEEANPLPEEAAEETEDAEPSEYALLLARLSKEDDPYEPVARNVPESKLQEILDLDLPGIDYVLQKTRSYPETQLGGHIFGYVGPNGDGEKQGFYGLEGTFNEFLAGKNGFIDSETDASGRWIGVGSREFSPATDGGDLLLTIDRTLQYVACQKLREGVERYEADSGTLIIMDPETGAIIAMCNVPDFDPNVYNEVEDIAVYNNNALIGAYEPGSVFKPIVMASAIDVGAVSPTTLYNDTGEEKIDEYTIRNSDLKAHGVRPMTYVLEESLNTGMIFVMRKMGMETMKQYIERFGFGTITGVDLAREVAGDISSLDILHEIFYATASYGQGITATPMQIASAYAALANGGALVEPYIVAEKRLPNGEVEEQKPTVVRQVISKKTAQTISAMMVSVVENGHGDKASVPGYFIAGKTGTAQVPKRQGVGYEKDHTKVTFAGFGPVENPEFVMVVMMDRPRAVPWAADTAAPVFGEIAEFLLHYRQVAPTRNVENDVE